MSDRALCPRDTNTVVESTMAAASRHICPPPTGWIQAIQPLSKAVIEEAGPANVLPTCRRPVVDSHSQPLHREESPRTATGLQHDRSPTWMSLQSRRPFVAHHLCVYGHQLAAVAIGPSMALHTCEI